MTDDLSELLHDTARAGVYALSLPTAMLGAATRHIGFLYLEIDAAEIYDQAGLATALAEALEFPQWSGGDWDTFEDFLMDLSWIEEPGLVLVLKDCDALMEESPDDFAAALEIFDDAAAFWHQTERPFWVFVGSADPGEFELPLLGP
jgi:RNAse (barnase) inhibitor barstar